MTQASLIMEKKLKGCGRLSLCWTKRRTFIRLHWWKSVTPNLWSLSEILVVSTTASRYRSGKAVFKFVLSNQADHRLHRSPADPRQGLGFHQESNIFLSSGDIWGRDRWAGVNAQRRQSVDLESRPVWGVQSLDLPDSHRTPRHSSINYLWNLFCHPQLLSHLVNHESAASAWICTPESLKNEPTKKIVTFLICAGIVCLLLLLWVKQCWRRRFRISYCWHEVEESLRVTK